jgi:outer membrane protein OmpA-like peptidoglycan-associated protein
MASTLIDSVKSVFTDVHISKFSVLLGEAEGNIQKAVHAAIPIELIDALHESSSPGGATKIWNLSKQAANSDFFGHLHELTVGSGGLVVGSILLNKGTDLARNLLTVRTDAVINEISRYAGVSVPSAAFIVGITSFAALDSIGRHVANSNVDANGLAYWLAAQKDSIIHAIPAGLQVKSALGIHHYPGEKVIGVRRNTALYVAVILIVLFVAAFFIYRSRRETDVVNTNTSSTTDTMVTTPAPVATRPDTITSPAIQVSLPNGRVIEAHKGGMEDQLVSFLNDPHAKLDKRNGNWFDFTNIGFASNSASLLLESETQLKNIVAILDAFPKAKIKIGGYSDNTGDSVDNKKLSQQRADNILTKLEDLGARPSHLTGAEGYGTKYPVGDNGTAAGRAMNRRMSIDVKAK